jgi:hypothetical protein
MGQLDQAVSLFDQSLAAATAGGDGFTESIAMHHIGRMQLFAGQTDAAAATFRDSLRLSIGLDHDEGVAYAIEGLSAIAALGGDLDRAGVLAGAAETIRQRVTMFDYPAFVYHRRTSSGRHPMRRRRPGSRKRPSGAAITRRPKSPNTRSARRSNARRLPSAADARRGVRAEVHRP